jgi:hypothetical protein
MGDIGVNPAFSRRYSLTFSNAFRQRDYHQWTMKNRVMLSTNEEKNKLN